MNIPVSRRYFLALAGLAAGGGVYHYLRGRPFNDQPPTVSVTNPLTVPKPPIGSHIHRQARLVTQNFDPLYQELYIKRFQTGQSQVVDCHPPSRVLPRRGFSYPNNDFDWDKLKLQPILINGRRFPLLTSQEITQESLEFLERWYSDPRFIDQQLARLQLANKAPSPIKTLVVHYRSVRHDYWEKTDSGCHKLFDDSPLNDPQTLFEQLANSLAENTTGIFDYQQVGFETFDEGSLPLTNNPADTYPDLINAHRRTINYQALAQLALNNGVSTVYVYAGNSGGMYESATWTERNSGQPVTIFAMNYDLDYHYSLHSWTHYLEGLFHRSPVATLYSFIVGRDPDYQIPLVDDDCRLRNTAYMDNGQEYATVGIGNVHFAPSSLYHYQYDSPLLIRYPGQKEAITSQFWGVDQTNYLSWWLRTLPQPLLASIAASLN